MSKNFGEVLENSRLTVLDINKPVGIGKEILKGDYSRSQKLCTVARSPKQTPSDSKGMAVLFQKIVALQVKRFNFLRLLLVQMNY